MGWLLRNTTKPNGLIEERPPAVGTSGTCLAQNFTIRESVVIDVCDQVPYVRLIFWVIYVHSRLIIANHQAFGNTKSTKIGVYRSHMEISSIFREISHGYVWLPLNQYEPPNRHQIDDAEQHGSASDIFGTFCKYMIFSRKSIYGGFDSRI